MLKQLIHTLVGEQEEKATITLFIVILQRRVAIITPQTDYVKTFFYLGYRLIMQRYFFIKYLIIFFQIYRCLLFIDFCLFSGQLTSSYLELWLSLWTIPGTPDSFLEILTKSHYSEKFLFLRVLKVNFISSTEMQMQHGQTSTQVRKKLLHISLC